MEHKKTRKNKYTWYLIMTISLIAATVIVGILVFSYYINSFTLTQTSRQYDKYYVMITSDENSSLWQAVYEGAAEAGKEENSCIDWLNCDLESSYSREDLMRIAIAAQPDGIIVTADESDEMTELIDQATEAGIPVVTLYGDNTQSSRCSYVGIGSYDLGMEYGRQVLSLSEDKKSVKVMVLVNDYAQDFGQNILCSGLQETIEAEKKKSMQVDVSIVTVDDTNTFSAEESIRDIFMEEELPDIIITLNEVNTTCVYQAVVEHNKVGQIKILGYYDSETILNAIENGVIDATISIDTEQMGRFCVEALTEYNTSGATSQYFMVDLARIDSENIAEYREKGDGEDE
jgi:ribose transport system substrate-binding protein